MKALLGSTLALALLGTATFPAQPVAALQGNAGHMHVGHVLDGFPAAPEGQGLLPTAEAEAAVAAQHARLASSDDTNLQWMQTHARHVLHAVDPSRIDEGPGLGFGVTRAAEAMAQHITMAAETEGASDNLRTHAGHVAAAATSVAERAAQIAELAEQVERASDYTAAGDLIREMRILSDQLLTGVDLDGNGQISWGGGEGGLEQARQHMTFLAQGEGLD